MVDSKLYAIRNARGLYNKTGPLGGWVKDLNRATFFSAAKYARKRRTDLKNWEYRGKLEVVEVAVRVAKVVADPPKRKAPRRVKLTSAELNGFLRGPAQ